MPVIGFLHQGSAGANVKVIDAFRHGLQEAGYEEGRNAHVEFRWADGHYERLGALAAEVVRLRPAVMAPNHSGGGEATPPSCRCHHSLALRPLQSV